MNAWDQIKTHLGSKLSAVAYQDWLARTGFRGLEEGVLYVEVPDEPTRTRMAGEYSGLVGSAIRALALPVLHTVYELNAPANGSRSDAAGAAELFAQPPGSHLNPKFTFDTFIVGSCNQFAHAAAKAVAEKPSRSYNPLFIHGGVGMGKTHIMHAIGRALLDNHKNARIVYTSSERFMNEMIQCIRLQRMPQFQQYYRNADVLLIDDIQMLGGKEGIQKEFFHTFNELYDQQKQIVICSDSQPKDIPGLVERLRSRFEWGLMVDIQAPDLETKMAILDKKAEAEGVVLPDDVRILIATKTKSNIRELEGALIKLIAYSSVTGTPINLALARHCLKNIVHTPERKITIEAVQKAVAERFGLQAPQLKLKSNTKRIVEPRQIAMYIAKELTGSSLPEIGRAFGGKHHTTVLHSIQKIENLRRTDVDLNRTIHKLIDSIN